MVKTFARLSTWDRAFICGMRRAKAPRSVIRKAVKKTDGTHPTLRAVDAVLANERNDPDYNGENSRAGGRPRALSAAEAKRVVQLVFAERGKARVTAAYCRRRLPFLRRVSEDTVRKELQRAGLAWRRRRRKTSIPHDWRKKRVTYCKWLLTLPSDDVNRFAYSDGTVWFLARGPVEEHDKKRASLGPSVWRMVDGKDGLWDDNIGPSLYANAQGRPMKIWGFFCNGKLHYWLLPADGAKKTKHMNRARFKQLVDSKFAKLRKDCVGNRRVLLVQDHERCLWSDTSLAALRAAGCDVVKKHTKYSPDLNAIEAWWNRLRNLLQSRAPPTIETRAQFVLRLRRTVAWLNENAKPEARRLCRGVKTRAGEIIKLKGAKCKY